MNILDWLKPISNVEFEIDASLDECLERLECYQESKDWWIVLSRPKISISSIKNENLYTLQAEDKGLAASLSFELERVDNKTLVSGYLRYYLAPLLMMFLIGGLIVFSSALNAPDVPTSILICPMIPSLLVWSTLISSRSKLFKRIERALKTPIKQKRHQRR